METRNFLGNLRAEIRAVGIPTALRRTGELQDERKKQGDDGGNKYQKAKSHDA
jgi:hypothetical protein